MILDDLDNQVGTGKIRRRLLFLTFLYTSLFKPYNKYYYYFFFVSINSWHHVLLLVDARIVALLGYVYMK